ncbi:hypothetical protein [Rhizosaccharibacter radicis]|uniref:Auto-transporter adhesin head GIN domain-containing protein n=1 Tax=Rhizosaccharibacter radicis TaxID=2782605 RepID=A0ABT1VVF4_9PROT|nr:hypothetical protein [Acetobacteraceae bacterium KSS12]
MQFIHAAHQTGALSVWAGVGAVSVETGAGATDIHSGSGSLAVTVGSGSLAIDLSGTSGASLRLDGGSVGNVDISGFSAGRDQVVFSAGSVTGRQIVGGSLVVQMQDGHAATFHGLADGGGIAFG